MFTCEFVGCEASEGIMRGDKNALTEAGSGEASETRQDQEGLTGDRKDPGGRKGQRPVETRGQRQMRTVQGHPPGKSSGEPKALKTHCLYFNQTVFYTTCHNNNEFRVRYL